jgi:hypothetical protein
LSIKRSLIKLKLAGALTAQTIPKKTLHAAKTLKSLVRPLAIILRPYKAIETDKNCDLSCLSE